MILNQEKKVVIGVNSDMIVTDPKAEIEINENLVKRLVASQFPEFSNLEIELLDAGWDNENYRLGSEFIIRMPRRVAASRLILNEITWLPKLKDKLPLNIPAPVRVGVPDKNYPWHWSIIPWFNGESANINLPEEAEVFKLIQFLKELHIKDPKDAPENLYRSIPLVMKNSDVEKRMKILKGKTSLITERIEKNWYEAINETTLTEKYLIHGDLHPKNIIVQEGRIEAIIDWGDITAGDPATDLACLWMLFNQHEICDEALSFYGASRNLIKRSIGWAIFFGTMFLDTGLNSNPGHVRIGESTLKNLDQYLIHNHRINFPSNAEHL
jgi:aminoglycoside phosphotransferase (APT) family kinase protein